MREIKFRAWHKEQKKMYSAEELGEDQLTIMPDGRGFANISSESTTKSHIDNFRKMIPLQFTGLKDKNGKEIYEGYIIKWRSGISVHETTFIGIIKYSGGAFISDVGGAFWFLNTLSKICEVIGNIYENPDLIKG